MLLILGGISFWMGLSGGDPFLDGGKNLLHFYFLYALGNEIKQRQKYFSQIQVKLLFLVYLAINVFVVFIFAKVLGRFYYSEVLYDWFFKYNSLFLTIDSCILFIVFNKLKFYSHFVNNVAASCFSVYLILEHRLIHRHIIEPVISCFLDPIHNLYFVFSITSFFAILLFLACYLIDSISVLRLTNFVSTLFHPNAVNQKQIIQSKSGQ